MNFLQKGFCLPGTFLFNILRENYILDPNLTLSSRILDCFFMYICRKSDIDEFTGTTLLKSNSWISCAFVSQNEIRRNETDIQHENILTSN
jgi:hypothetical protein